MTDEQLQQIVKAATMILSKKAPPASPATPKATPELTPKATPKGKWRDRVIPKVALKDVAKSPESIVSEASEDSSSGKRKHDKGNSINALATFLNKNYLKSKSVWKYIYNDERYINDERLEVVLKKVKLKLDKERQILLQNQIDTRRKEFFRKIKKRVVSAKSYRDVLKSKKKEWTASPFVIDLTNKEGESSSEESTGPETPPDPALQPQPNQKPKVVKVKKEPAAATPDPALQKPQPNQKPKVVKVKKEPTANAKEVRRTLARDFAARMEARRSTAAKRKRVKQVSRKAKALAEKKTTPPKKEKTNPPPPKKRTRKATAAAKKETEPFVPFKIGDKVSAKWSGKHNKGDWFPGAIAGIDVKKKTMYIKFDDGDHDKRVPWKHVMLQ